MGLSRCPRLPTTQRKMSTSYVPFIPLQSLHTFSLKDFLALVRHRHLLRRELKATRQRPRPYEDRSTASEEARPIRPHPHHRTCQRPAALWLPSDYIDHKHNNIIQRLNDQRKTQHHKISFQDDNHKHSRPPFGQYYKHHLNRRVSHHSRRALHNLHRSPANCSLYPGPSQALRRRESRRKIRALRR